MARVLRFYTERFDVSKERGRATMDSADECAEYILRIIQMEPAFRGVSVDPEP